MPTLLAVPNVSTAGDEEALGRLATAFGRGAEVLDFHTDADHGRSVFTLAGEPGGLAESLLAGAAGGARGDRHVLLCGARTRRSGRSTSARSSGCARRIATRPAPRRSPSPTQIGGLGVPVFLYGELAREPGRAERAYFRNGGLAELWLRMEGGELRPDFGPPVPHPRGGATLVTARPPLAAFNVELEGADLDAARADRRGAARGGRRGARGAGDRADAVERPRPGLDQRPRPADDDARRRGRGGAAGWRRRSARARSRRSWSG